MRDVMDGVKVNNDLTIPERELNWRFETSGGPGGQHANRSATRVILEFDVASSVVLPDKAREQLLVSEGHRIVVSVDQTRSQWRNRQIAKRRLRDQLARALAPPAPQRRPTRPTRASREQRLTDKRKRSERKQQRRRPDWE